MRVKQPGSGSGLLWILAGRKLLRLLLDPSLDQLADAGIGALVTGFFQPLEKGFECVPSNALTDGVIGDGDETFEIVTWRQLGLHDKPIFLVDIAGYWRPLIDLFEHIVTHGFARPVVPQIVHIVPSIPSLMAALGQAAPGAGTRSELF